VADRRLLSNPGFRRLWVGETVSVFGDQVTALALPLAAVLVLHASTFQVGLLTGAGTLAFPVIGLPVGVWVDRLRRRPVMIVADLVRAVALASIPVAYAAGVLRLPQLYAVALLEGAGTVFFDVAYMSYLPGLVGREHLVDANAKLQVSQSVAQVSGPAATGFLVGLLSAPVALVTDAVSFLVSAASLMSIREPEPAPERHGSTSLRGEMAEGLRFVGRHRTLRMIAAATSTGNLCNSAFYAVNVVFLVRVVGVGASTIGVLTAAAAAGGILGALTATWWRRRLGSARVIWVSLTATAPWGLLAPLTSRGPALALYAAGLFVMSVGVVVYNVNQASFRQLLCPPRLLGRMNATMRVVVWGTMPLGALVGGALGTALGPRGALWAAAGGLALTPGWLLASPLLRLRDVDDAEAGEERAPSSATLEPMQAAGRADGPPIPGGGA